MFTNGVAVDQLEFVFKQASPRPRKYINIFESIMYY